MSVLFILVVVSLIVAGSFLGAFIWAVRSGQFVDTHTPPMRLLSEEQNYLEKTKPRMTETTNQ